MGRSYLRIRNWLNLRQPRLQSRRPILLDRGDVQPRTLASRTLLASTVTAIAGPVRAYAANAFGSGRTADGGGP
jgi:hypothetical protein